MVFWSFACLSMLICAIGILFVVVPEKALFLMPKDQRRHLLENCRYKLIARIGGLLMVFVCAPLSFLFAILIGHM